jgi:hypothetical protein
MKDSDLEAIADTFEDFAGEDQETDTLEGEAEEIDNGETDAEEQPEDLADGEAPEGEDPEAEDTDSDDQVRITLDDGTETTLAELKRGHFRETDYTHKTTELADERKQVAADRDNYAERSKFVETTLTNLTGYLENLVPPEPSLSLAQTDPSSYQYQKALRENAIGELSQLVQMQDGLGQAQQGYSQEDITRLKSDQETKLLKAMPQLADQTKRAAFDTAVKETALEFGFTEDEVAGAADHRILQLVHYARLGKRAVTNRNNAKRRVETPKTGKTRQARVTAKSVTNRKAKERLSKSGTLDDAMSIDFD